MVGSSGGSEPTFYETLGVEDDASVAELRDAYRERAKETHPDVSDEPDAGRRFRRVKRAHEVLTDEAERRRYDRLGHEAFVRRERRTSEREPPARSGHSDAPGDGAAGRSAGGTGTRTRDGTRGRATAGRTDRRAGNHRDAASAGRSPGTARATEGRSVGRVAYWTAWWLNLAVTAVDAWQSRLDPAAAATALAAFAAYPVLLASTVTPLFPIPVNLLVGTCLLGIIAYLVLRPAVGVAVLGAWFLLLPIALTVTGIGVVSLGGLYAVVLTVVPLVLCVVTLLGGAA